MAVRLLPSQFFENYGGDLAFYSQKQLACLLPLLLQLESGDLLQANFATLVSLATASDLPSSGAPAPACMHASARVSAAGDRRGEVSKDASLSDASWRERSAQSRRRVDLFPARRILSGWEECDVFAASLRRVALACCLRVVEEEGAFEGDGVDALVLLLEQWMESALLETRLDECVLPLEGEACEDRPKQQRLVGRLFASLWPSKKRPSVREPDGRESR